MSSEFNAQFCANIAIEESKKRLQEAAKKGLVKYVSSNNYSSETINWLEKLNFKVKIRKNETQIIWIENIVFE